MSLYTEYLDKVQKWYENRPISHRIKIKRDGNKNVIACVLINGQIEIEVEGSCWVENIEDLKTRLLKSKGEDLLFTTQELCVELFVLSKTEVCDILCWLNTITREDEK